LIDAIIIAQNWMEYVVNPIEKVMASRSSHVKLAAAVALLIVVLWATGSAVQTLWVTPIIIVVLWTAIQVGLGYRRRHHGA
jgi:hypothetical protein